jgi:hypothetical protein
MKNMTTAKRKSKKPSSLAKSISSVLGSPPTLPGESAEEYQLGLQAVIEELEAKTVMQVYLAEKIFECLWWMSRYEQQKRAILARIIGKILDVKEDEETSTDFQLLPFDHKEKEPSIVDEVNNMEIVLDPNRRSEFEQLLSQTDHTEQSLMQEALSYPYLNIYTFDDKINLLIKNLSGFQASYEVLVNRKLNIERLRLQNELLEKDIGAIDVKVIPDASQS